ncbi:hypothetical protein M5C90_16290 [Pseudomonas chlororaphis subsp. piscium]|nr:hypothetical protein M5C90_16290 [Pseudomonas chlororaphis subsp. piscium]
MHGRLDTTRCRRLNRQCGHVGENRVLDLSLYNLARRNLSRRRPATGHDLGMLRHKEIGQFRQRLVLKNSVLGKEPKSLSSCAITLIIMTESIPYLLSKAST